MLILVPPQKKTEIQSWCGRRGGHSAHWDDVVEIDILHKVERTFGREGCHTAAPTACVLRVRSFRNDYSSPGARNRLLADDTYAPHEVSVFARDVKMGGAKEFDVDTFAGFACHTLDFEHPHHRYEVALEGKPVWLYFDIDFPVQQQTTIDVHGLMHTFFLYLDMFFKDNFSCQLDPASIIQLDSTTPIKISRHVVIKSLQCRDGSTRPAAFATNAHVGSLVHRIVCYFRDRAEAEPASSAKDLFYETSSTGDRRKCIVDLGVYDRNRCFRTLFSSKLGSSSCLSLLADSSMLGCIRPLQLLNSLITLVSPAVRLFEDSLLTTPDKLACRSTSRASMHGAHPYRIRRSQPPSTVAPTCSADIDELQRHIMSVWDRVSGDGCSRQRQSWSVKLYPRCLTLTPSLCRYCCKVARGHRSNHVYFVVDPQQGTFWQKCHNEACRSYRSKPFRLPMPLAGCCKALKKISIASHQQICGAPAVCATTRLPEMLGGGVDDRRAGSDDDSDRTAGAQGGPAQGVSLFEGGDSLIGEQVIPPTPLSMKVASDNERGSPERSSKTASDASSCQAPISGTTHPASTNTVNVVGKRMYMDQIISQEKKWEGRPYRVAGEPEEERSRKKKKQNQLERCDENDTLVMRESRFQRYPRMTATILAKRIYPTLRAMVEELLPDGLLPGVSDVDEAIGVYQRRGKAYKANAMYCALRLVDACLEDGVEQITSASPVSGNRGRSKRGRPTRTLNQSAEDQRDVGASSSERDEDVEVVEPSPEMFGSTGVISRKRRLHSGSDSSQKRARARCATVRVEPSTDVSACHQSLDDKFSQAELCRLGHAAPSPPNAVMSKGAATVAEPSGGVDEGAMSANVTNGCSSLPRFRERESNTTLPSREDYDEYCRLAALFKYPRCTPPKACLDDCFKQLGAVLGAAIPSEYLSHAAKCLAAFFSNDYVWLDTASQTHLDTFRGLCRKADPCAAYDCDRFAALLRSCTCPILQRVLNHSPRDEACSTAFRGLRFVAMRDRDLWLDNVLQHGLTTPSSFSTNISVALRFADPKVDMRADIIRLQSQALTSSCSPRLAAVLCIVDGAHAVGVAGFKRTLLGSDGEDEIWLREAIVNPYFVNSDATSITDILNEPLPVTGFRIGPGEREAIVALSKSSGLLLVILTCGQSKLPSRSSPMSPFNNARVDGKTADTARVTLLSPHTRSPRSSSPAAGNQRRTCRPHHGKSLGGISRIQAETSVPGIDSASASAGPLVGTEPECQTRRTATRRYPEVSSQTQLTAEVSANLQSANDALPSPTRADIDASCPATPLSVRINGARSDAEESNDGLDRERSADMSPARRVPCRPGNDERMDSPSESPPPQHFPVDHSHSRPVRPSNARHDVGAGGIPLDSPSPRTPPQARAPVAAASNSPMLALAPQHADTAESRPRDSFGVSNSSATDLRPACPTEAMTAAIAAARTEGAGLRRDVAGDKDPGGKIRGDIAAAKTAVLRKFGAVAADLLVDEPKRELIFDELTRNTYNEEALNEAFDIGSWCESNSPIEGPRGEAQRCMTLKDHLKNHFTNFFDMAIARDYTSTAALAYQKANGLHAMADRWTGVACSRIAQCNGLPKDGHVVHSTLQGRMKSWYCGPEADLAVEVVEDSESPWQHAGHGCGVWLIGHSGLGKDNLINIVTHWMRVLASAFPQRPCLTELDIGRLSYTGLLETLAEGKSKGGTIHWLTWMNSEITQCISQEQGGIRERDICQLAEGTAMGKRIKGKKVRQRASFWCAIGAQEDAFTEVFGSNTFGRLRCFAALIDELEVFKVPFLSKLAARNQSMNFILEMLALCIAWQQPAEGDPRFKKIHYSPGALSVFAAFAEAASEFLARLATSGGKDRIAKWRQAVSTLIKFAGKGHGALAVANLACRVAAWSVSEREPTNAEELVNRVAQTDVRDFDSWADNTIRFHDALAAAAKIMIHIVNQLSVEQPRASDPSGQARGKASAANKGNGRSGGAAQWGANLKLDPSMHGDAAAVGRKILEGFTATARGRAELQLSSLCVGGTSGVSRLVFERIGAPKPQWREGIKHLIRIKILQWTDEDSSMVKLHTEEAELRAALEQLDLDESCTAHILGGSSPSELHAQPQQATAMAFSWNLHHDSNTAWADLLLASANMQRYATKGGRELLVLVCSTVAPREDHGRITRADCVDLSPRPNWRRLRRPSHRGGWAPHFDSTHSHLHSGTLEGSPSWLHCDLCTAALGHSLPPRWLCTSCPWQKLPAVTC